jgi:NAD(P)-dependent dehydrogenase (short-subunit alcohol dehydrogenase family)
MKLKGKLAIVTGAGRGIGKAIALALAREVADIVAVSRTISEVTETAREVQSLGRRALAMKVDVANKDEVEEMVSSCIRRFEKIDILVNNAGVQPPIGPVIENDPEQWLRTVAVNLGGTFLCSRAVLPFMMKRRQGKIINLSGGGATSPRPYFTAYAASKTAVVRFTETLAQEVKEYNVQVNAIAPGAVNTRMLEEVIAAGEMAGAEASAGARRQKETGGTPPEKAAVLAVFLASDESNGLSGRLISAVWDDWKGMAGEVEEIMTSELYTLRRVVKPQ